MLLAASAAFLRMLTSDTKTRINACRNVLVGKLPIPIVAAQTEAVRSRLPRFEAKIQRVLDRVWGTA